MKKPILNLGSNYLFHVPLKQSLPFATPGERNTRHYLLTSISFQQANTLEALFLRLKDTIQYLKYVSNFANFGPFLLLLILGLEFLE